MKISELIANLTLLQAKFGDHEVYLLSPSCGGHEPIYRISVETVYERTYYRIEA